MKSMTGCGRGECAQDGFKITVEVQSINRKQADIQVDLPRDLEVLESSIRDTIHQAVSRGRLTVKVLLHAPTGRNSARMHLNRPLAKAYTLELRRLAKELKLEGNVSLDHLIRAPGVFQTDEQLVQAEDFWPAVEKALGQALGALLRMRAREGAHLAKDLSSRTGVANKDRCSRLWRRKQERAGPQMMPSSRCRSARRQSSPSAGL